MSKSEHFNQKRSKLEEAHKAWNAGSRGGELEDTILAHLHHGLPRGRQSETETSPDTGLCE